MYERSSVAELVDTLRGELDRYSPGGKLPSSRALVDRFRVSPVTVSRALAQLAAEGLVVTRPGAGAFRARPRASAATAGDTSWQEVALSADGAADLVPRSVDASGVLVSLAAPAPGVVEFNGGYLHPSLQPERAMAAALARAGRRPGAWGRPPMEGLPELREWFARGIGGAITAAEVLITAGGQSALTTALRALAPPGTAVLVESPTYPGMLAIARAAGLRPVPVPVDADGVRPALLADAFRATGARVFVCQPLCQNPTGAVLAPERRGEVLRIARAAGAFVVEDDFVRRLVHEDAGPLPAPLAADDPDGVVVHVCSLTKATSPSFRVSALAARGPVLERLRAIQVVDTFFVPRPLQEAALELVGSPAWPRHLRAISAQLKARRDAMTSALRLRLPEVALPHVPSGGYHLWLRLPEGTDELALTAAALRAGVAITPGRPYFSAEPPAAHLRLSFAAVANTGEITEGVRRLRAACTEVRGG
ncbi:PLP-dependent aminotransferase family protein [Streptomyces olivaceus]|uniref:PLP-dependent aminotransferase family protein n=1 Tax=Streptomyces olivaceus TaxID=47716 RepID=A0ABS7W669_STROV|nr:PLP-dependent aminotransferase family protein [Streptomyces olivaceus]MBZ6090170.1 PLP-dependent aminotransferase family protein [Streptomyces olivaceus]MBZ6096346.1 PLP-dependent aminotransferase family protein [Streptomyces olivaceus]MBZ6117258.1 PLP-dependent aminotransferase family protein [Streptomyces olivaceus]MBZ6152670.1 PLP-dependent aminotransferase family protein [Streptomyces olivaceus]MBZ6207299.1 PLP-dependent aminotransferase family protein [Streptomyces olivaceus]